MATELKLLTLGGDAVIGQDRHNSHHQDLDSQIREELLADV